MWTFSDGTVFHVGGSVEGSSLFARELREKVDLVLDGTRLWAPTRPLPASGHQLDLQHAGVLDVWLEQQGKRAGLRIVERPTELPALPDDGFVDAPYDPEVVY